MSLAKLVEAAKRVGPISPSDEVLKEGYLESLVWTILFIRLTCYLGRSRSIQLSRSISCDLAAISPIQVPFFFSSSRCARISTDKTKTRLSFKET